MGFSYKRLVELILGIKLNWPLPCQQIAKSMSNTFYISTDKSKLHVDLIVDFLNNQSYWAKNRNKAIIEKSIQNSLCFAIFTGDNEQVGFARVITDFAVFAWVLDVFVLENYRGQGLGKLLMQYITSYKELQEVKRWGLATNDAHGLYQQFGFTALTKPELMMEKVTR